MSWIFIIIAGFILLGWVLIGYNRLVKARNRVIHAESDIEVQFKRRYDLIPNLIESVKGYMKHERETLGAIVKARDEAQRAKSTTPIGRQAENVFEGALKSLFALAENYPDLKASQNFLQLQDELIDTEDKIQAARRLYNKTLIAYKNILETFPDLVFARIFNFELNGEFFEVANEAERKVVQVGF